MSRHETTKATWQARVTRIIFTAAIGLFLMVGHSPIVRGQELVTPQPRQGYYISLGAHGMLNGNTDNDDTWHGPWGGPGGELRFGESITPWLDLGLNMGVSFGFSEKYLGTVGHVALDAQFRPVDPFFLRLSLGFGFTDVTRRISGIAAIDGSIGAFYQLAAGYDFFPFYKKGSGGFAVTPVVGFAAVPGELLTSLLGYVGIELSFWTGLTKDKLNLPDEEAF